MESRWPKFEANDILYLADDYDDDDDDDDDDDNLHQRRMFHSLVSSVFRFSGCNK